MVDLDWVQQAQALATAVMSPGGAVVILCLFLFMLIGALVFIVNEFKKVNTRFIDFITQQTTLFENQLEVCEKRCESNSTYFFGLIEKLIIQQHGNGGDPHV